MLRASSSRSTVVLVLLSLVSLSLLPGSLADSYCPEQCQNSHNNERCSCGTCRCDDNNYAYCSDSLCGGAVAGIVVGVIAAVAIVLCLLSLCYRRRYYNNNYAGSTYATGARTITTGVPMQAVPVGGYGNAQPMQAIPVQYGQYPQPDYGGQPVYNPYGTTYAQTPVGGGMPIEQSGPPPAYAPQSTAPTAPDGETRGEITYPSKPSQYSGERAL